MIYCDLDGVLADFDGGYYNLFHIMPRTVERPYLWYQIEKLENYWLNLALMPDSDLLLNELKKHAFKILTGLPKIGFEKAETQKRQWVQKYIGEGVPVICTFSKDKALYCKGKEDILIDDWMPNIQDWQKAGGTGIFYRNAKQVLDELKNMNI